MSSRNFAIVETGEGCLSRVIVSHDYVIRAWVEGVDPEEVGGWAVALSAAGEAGLRGRGECGFIWHGTRVELAEMARVCPRYLADDPRMELDPPAARQ